MAVSKSLVIINVIQKVEKCDGHSMVATCAVQKVELCDGYLYVGHLGGSGCGDV